MQKQKSKPIYLNIPKIRLPIPGIVSILHRITSIALFTSLPILLFLFSGILNKEDNFILYQKIVSYPIIKIMLLGILWAFIHHAIAGVRFLLLDIEKGIELKTARLTAQITLATGIILTIIIGIIIW